MAEQPHSSVQARGTRACPVVRCRKCRASLRPSAQVADAVAHFNVMLGVIGQWCGSIEPLSWLLALLSRRERAGSAGYCYRCLFATTGVESVHLVLLRAIEVHAPSGEQFDPKQMRIPCAELARDLGRALDGHAGFEGLRVEMLRLATETTEMVAREQAAVA